MRDDSATPGTPDRDTEFVQTTPAVSIPALDYTQLRLLAECTAGYAKERVHFVFTQPQDGQSGPATLELHRGDAELEPTSVLVPATGGAERFPANAVTLGTTTARPAEAGDDGSYPFAAGDCDAVFWSDAAVQKFVFPYVASCGGSQGAAALGQLQRAWNDYPTDQVTVYALAHLTRFALNTPIRLGNAFAVVYAEAGSSTLAMLPVEDFLARFQPSGGTKAWAAEEAVPYVRGKGREKPQFPGYVTLRALAEWACSITEPRYFVFQAGKHGFVGIGPDLKGVRYGDIVIPVQTPTMPADRPVLHGVWFQAEGEDTLRNLANQGDALFWCTGSIEQFLYPYYASKGGLDGLSSLREMGQTWEDGGANPPGADGDQRVLALIHLPSSEWSTETSVTQVDPRRDMGVVPPAGDPVPVMDHLMARQGR